MEDADTAETKGSRKLQGQPIAQRYNTRLNKMNDGANNIGITMDTGKITEYLQPLELKFNKESSSKKAKKDTAQQEREDSNMGINDKLLSASDTGVSSGSSQNRG